MKTHFLILAFACLFLQSEARLFGGSIGKWLGNDPSPEQDATDIAGGTTFSAPTAAGDTPHSRAGGPEVSKTADVIQTEISNGLRKDFQFIRDSMTAFADGDGFVREGLVFCGGPTVIAPPSGTDYHEDTGLLNIVDGYGNEIGSSVDKDACGASDCDEGSFVSLLANRIRALGYHVTHSDICIARAEEALPSSIVPTARTCKLQNNNIERKSYECTKSDYEAGIDFFQINQKCYEGKDADACADIKDNTTEMCTFDSIEKLCQAKNDYVKDKCNGDSAAGEKSGENIAADGSEKNAVRRVISYSIRNPGEVPLTDKTYVTGVAAATGGTNDCKSLRQYVAALNGMAQINAFRDRNIQEADDNWAETIKEARTFVASYAEILDNFYDKSLLIFPPIEFEEFQDCPAGDVRQSAKDDGTKAAPLCDNTDYSAISTFNEMTANSQALLRSQCFCRKGSLPQATKVADNDKYEADDFYLSMTDKGGRTNCTEFENLPSVYQFCEHGNMESQRWRNALEALEPHESSIKVFGTTAQQNERRAKIYNNLLKTLPLVSSKYKPNCGRLISSDADEMMYSNKGGNCLPFPGMGELLYRLEFETSKAEIGSTRGAGGVGGAVAGTFGTRFCQVSDKLANTLFSFRQIAYLWDHARFADASDTSVMVPTASALIADFPNDVNTQTSTAGALTDQLFSHGDAKMCNIDWTEELTGQHTRKDSAGSSYDNPYLLFDREIEEAIFNAGVAVQAKRQNAADNENLWSALEAELTSVDTVRLNADIAHEAAEHFMRIVTTDADDKAVDATDADGAVDAGTEHPSALDICDLNEAAASNNTCAKCTGDRAVTVADIDLYLSSTDAQKELQRATARSQPSKDFKDGKDSNNLSCNACPEDNYYVNGSSVCVPCLGITTKTAYTAGRCDVPLCQNADFYMDSTADMDGSTGTWTCKACPHDSVAPAESVGLSSCKDPGCDVGEYYDAHKCKACPGNSTSPANSTDISHCHGRNQCGEEGAKVSGNTYYDATSRKCVSCAGELQSNATTDGVGAATCIPKECSAGTFWDNNNNKCEICAGNSTSDAGAVGQAECHGRSQCNSYDNHYFKAGDNSCQPCPHDSVHNASDPARVGQDSCIDPSCDAGLYYDNFECKACPGNSTSVKGSTDVSDCNGDGVCDAGDYFEDGLNGGGGTVNDCTACPHQSTSEQGQVSITACGNPGCDAGQYFQGFKCETCPGNSTSAENSTGAQSCHGNNQCNAGQYFDDDNTTDTHNQCVDCPGNSTSGGDQIGLASCNKQVCEAGDYYEDGSGDGDKNFCTACPGASNSSAGAIGLDECNQEVCDVDKYYADDNTCTDCPNHLTTNGTNGQIGLASCVAATCNEGDYWEPSSELCVTCPGNSTTGDPGAVNASSCVKTVCGINQYYEDDPAGDGDENFCTACPGEKHTNGEGGKIGVDSCVADTCNAGDYWDGDDNKCETCENDSTTNDPGAVGADSCTGVDVCTNTDEYFDATSKNCTKCQGDYQSTNASLVGTQADLCKGDVCAANSFMPTAGSGKGDECLACPGESTSAAEQIGFDHCDGNITAYIDYGEDDLLANINSEGDQRFRNIEGDIDGDFGRIYKSDTVVPDAVCRAYTSLTANCAVGYARSSDGEIKDFDLTIGQSACNGVGFDITGERGDGPRANFEADGASEALGGGADVCVKIPTLNTDNQDDPRETLDAVDHAIGDDDNIIDVYNTLEDLDDIKSGIENYIDSGHDDYWSLLGVPDFDSMVSAEATYTPDTGDTWVNEYEGITTEDAGRANFTDDIDTYDAAVADYNIKLTAYKAHLRAIVDNANLLKDDLEAIRDLAGAAAVENANNAASAAKSELEGQQSTTGDAWQEVFERDALATYEYAELGDEHGAGVVSQKGTIADSKAYRKSIFELDAEIKNYAEKQAEILTQGQRFGSCSNGESVDATHKLVVGPKISDSCNSTFTTAITEALQGLGIDQTISFNSTLGWDDFKAGSAKELKDAFDAVEDAKQTIADGHTNRRYDTLTNDDAAPALGGGQEAINPSEEDDAGTLLAALNGKKSQDISGWA